MYSCRDRGGVGLTWTIEIQRFFIGSRRYDTLVFGNFRLYSLEASEEKGGEYWIFRNWNFKLELRKMNQQQITWWCSLENRTSFSWTSAGVRDRSQNSKLPLSPTSLSPTPSSQAREKEREGLLARVPAHARTMSWQQTFNITDTIFNFNLTKTSPTRNTTVSSYYQDTKKIPRYTHTHTTQQTKQFPH